MTTLGHLVRRYFPDAADGEVDSILFECTAFPFARMDLIESQLQDLAHKANSAGDAVYLSHGEFDREWSEHKRATEPTPADRQGFAPFEYEERN